MREVSDDDWKEYTFPHVTNSIVSSIADGQSPSLHFAFIAELYRLYRLGEWNCRLPDASSIADKTYLLWKDEAYCLYHQTHERFGDHIIECAHPYAENMFVFFDYSILQPIFDVLDEGGAAQTPYIPTYYARPSDRHDYKTGAQMW